MLFLLIRKQLYGKCKIDTNGIEIRVLGDVVNEETYMSLVYVGKYKD